MSEETDWEGNFYKAMALIPKADIGRMVSNVKKDTFDASIGPSIGYNSDGDIALMLVFTESTGKMLLEAWDALADHSCHAAELALMGWVVHQMILLELFSPSFTADGETEPYFVHNTKRPCEGPEYE